MQPPRSTARRNGRFADRLQIHTHCSTPESEKAVTALQRCSMPTSVVLNICFCLCCPLPTLSRAGERFAPTPRKDGKINSLKADYNQHNAHLDQRKTGTQSGFSRGFIGGGDCMLAHTAFLLRECYAQIFKRSLIPAVADASVGALRHSRFCLTPAHRSSSIPHCY